MSDRAKRLQLVVGLLIITMIMSVQQIDPLLMHQSVENSESPKLKDTFIQSYTIHDPFTILANDNFTSQGFPGNGTISNPYIIEGYNVTNPGTCIEIRDTDAFFVIRNCLLKNSANGATISLNYLENAELYSNTIIGDFEDGVYIYRSTNVTVVNNILSEHDIGVNVLDSSDNTIMNNTIYDSRVGILVDASGLGYRLGRNNIVDNKINGSAKGVMLIDSSDNVLSSNILVTTGIGVGGDHVDEWRQTITPDNLVNGKPVGYFWNLTNGNIDCAPFSQVILANCTGVTVRDALIYDDVGGIDLGHSSFCSLINNTISNNFDGIILYYSSHNTLSNNTLSGNRYGLTVDGTSNIVINNTIAGNGHGVFIVSANGNSILNNTISESQYQGIFLYETSDTTIMNNTISRNEFGITMMDSSDNTLMNNTFVDNGIHIDGNNVVHWRHTITSDNLVNGKPIGYFWSLTSGVYESDQYSNVILANCTGVTIENCILTSIEIGHSSFCNLKNNVMVGNTNFGLQLYHSSKNLISSNTISGAENGVSLRSSMNNTIIDNTISEADNGIFFWYAANNTVMDNYISECEFGFFVIGGYDNLIVSNKVFQNSRGGFGCSYSDDYVIMNNTISNNGAGIDIYSSSGYVITNNTISRNSQGVRLTMSDDNSIFNNSIIDNGGDGVYISQSSNNNLFYLNIIAGNGRRNAYDAVGGNQWNTTGIGNFWGDYSGTGVYAISGTGGSIDYHPFGYDFEPTTTTPMTDPTSTVATEPTIPIQTHPTPTLPTTTFMRPEILLGISIVVAFAVVVLVFVKKRT